MSFPRTLTPAWREPFIITPSDTADFAKPTHGGIYAGGTGDVQVVLEDSTVIEFKAVAGTVIPIVAIRVNATDTTANDLVGLA